MRLALILAALPFPVLAWDFSPDPICTLTHQATDAEIAVTYDPALPEYALYITLREGVWPQTATFGMRFSGGPPINISTTGHILSADGATLTVRDRGFGNVLDGIEFNTSVDIIIGNQTQLTADLRAADPAVQAFRACPSNVPATS